jgi:4-alpha-glucanotransferase
MTERSRGRRSGILMPLFSCPRTTGWGIGDISDLEVMTAWLAAAGQRVMQLLPINEMAPGQQSPYSAISAMAIDPIFIDVAAVPEFAAIGGEASLSLDDRARLDRARRSPSIDYGVVRQLKRQALRSAYERFVDLEWHRKTARATALTDFVAEQAWWIEEYSLFRAVHAAQDERPWTEWPAALRYHEHAAVADARQDLASHVLFHQFVQWIAHTQWRRARGRTHGVALFGDLPFMVDGDSADVWARQHQFHLDVSLGAPPDAFSATGQNWGMPVYRWDVIAQADFGWLRDRARRHRDLYDGYRIDHLVGFYRTYGWPQDGAKAFFTPDNETDQLVLGERVISIFRDSGAEVIAEDLGVVPDFVRESLTRLGVPGFKVFRWERQWHSEGQPFTDPLAYPPASVATSGTHDTETLAVWWQSASVHERREVARLAAVERVAPGAVDLGTAAFNPAVRDALLEALVESGSDLVLFPVQDVFGWLDRVNEPATINDRNWTFRLPWPIDRLQDVPEACERQSALHVWCVRHGRI